MDKPVTIGLLKTLLSPIKHLINKKAENVDWNENDPTSPGYINNRTHYKKPGYETLVPKQTITFDGSEPSVILKTYNYLLEEGTKYKVVVDGISYECSAFILYDAICIGNPGVIGESNTGEIAPFIIADMYDALLLFFIEPGDYEVSIEAPNTYIKTIDDEYLPDSIPRKDELASVAASGSYNDLSDKPSIFSGSYNDLSNKPSVYTGTGPNSLIFNHNSNVASGSCDFAQGLGTKAIGGYSHAEGYFSISKGPGSHAEGYYVSALGDFSHAQGKFNIIDYENKYAHIVGNGNVYTRSNAHTLDWDGNAWFAGTVEGKSLILASSTTDSTKTIKMTVDDTGLPTFTNTSDLTNSWTPYSPPTVTADDAGKFLRVSSTGEWAAESISNDFVLFQKITLDAAVSSITYDNVFNNLSGVIVLIKVPAQEESNPSAQIRTYLRKDENTIDYHFSSGAGCIATSEQTLYGILLNISGFRLPLYNAESSKSSISSNITSMYDGIKPWTYADGITIIPTFIDTIPVGTEITIYIRGEING